MLLLTTLLGSILASSVGAAEPIALSNNVPIIGPSFIANTDISESQAIQDAKEAFPGIIEGLFESGVLNSTDLVFAVDVFSAHTNSSIYNYYHVGEGMNVTLTSGELNDDTIGRVGSVSKLFTTYGLLVKAGIEVFSHPLTRYLPELLGNPSDDNQDHIRWEDITVGALASHQAGSGGAQDLLESLIATPENLTPEALFAYMRDVKHPVISPYRNALYSDAGYILLGQVLSRITGQPYKDAIRDVLFEPLGANITTVAPIGDNVNAINRTGLGAFSSWGFDIDLVASSGGHYASGSDLRTLGLSILNSELLSPANTQAWMKPMSGTGSLVELVGAPWEINRLLIPVTPGSNRTRVSDLYTKAGGTGDYTAVLALSPDHGIGYSILVAGLTAGTARWPIRQVLGEVFIPAAEHAMAENAERNLAGTFVNDDFEGTNLTLTVNEGEPGFNLTSFYINGTESRAVVLGLPEGTPLSTRVYPAGIYSNSRSLAALYQTNGTFKVSHRMTIGAFPPLPRPAVEGGEGGLFDNQLTWLSVDQNGPKDEFIFEIEDGKLVSVKSTGADLELKRVD